MCVDMLFDLSVPPGAWKMGCLSWRVWMNSGNNDNYRRLPASIAFPRLIFLFKEESCIEGLTMIFWLISQIFETCKGVQYKILIEIRELWEIISECLLAGVVVVMPCVLYASTMLGKLSVVSPSIKYLRFEIGKELHSSNSHLWSLRRSGHNI